MSAAYPETFPADDSYPTLDERAHEAAWLMATTLFPELYPVEERERYFYRLPDFYSKAARIVIEAIEEGIV